jgi:heterotetrameric sarcosine oxidase delta subunit
MLLIPCPWCGPRDEIEFHCGGQSHLARPEPWHAVDDATWGDYLFTRDNPRGLHLERWSHAAGCRRWFNVARDTVSHHILATYRMGEPVPEALQRELAAAAPRGAS